ncbi:hypothetical protein CDAR_27821 [Caerostris darwini]|uniref:Uncharacterized protein n=1 Tax=Caerostris darwini TaxID=1538125 RepID=A0AAV4SMU4_9ARAC|nr:hypothetical protein CDAR_27821 [Caerostris darwini]
MYNTLDMAIQKMDQFFNKLPLRIVGWTWIWLNMEFWCTWIWCLDLVTLVFNRAILTYEESVSIFQNIINFGALGYGACIAGYGTTYYRYGAKYCIPGCGAWVW